MLPVPGRPALRVAAGVFLSVLASHARADWKADVGATRLTATFTGVPTSAGVLTQAEAPADKATPADNYLPDSANAAFAGKTIVNKSSGTGTSGHATTVANYFYGASGSLLPATATIHAYNANGWINSGFLNFGGQAPVVETARVQNHSWVAADGTLTEAQVAEIDQRLDFAINRDGFVCVAGANNGNATTLPQLLAQAYNHITVGLTNGSHSAGFTVHDGAGRIKPDIVAPDVVTSFATPQVASSAGVLAARATQSPHSLSGADIPRMVKALLLAGATKEEFPAWTNTTSRPLDLRYGAGELNLLLAYRILETGRVTASASTLVKETGWAATSISAGAQQTYFFDIAADASAAPFSVALTWHRLVNDGTPGPLWSPSPVSLVNLDLALHEAAGLTVGTQLSTSASTVDNVEHLYEPTLAPGRYALVVSSPTGAANTAYALTWRSTPSVMVAPSVPDAREQDGSPGQFTITRTGATATPLLVPITVGGTAAAGGHYAALPASVLIPAGASSVTVTVSPVADSLAQGDRTVTLSVAGDYSLAAGASATAAVTIHDKPYDAWRFARFDAAQLAAPAIAGETADPDGDGVPNLLEYALGGEPLTGDSAAVSPALALEVDAETDAPHLTLSYTQPAGRVDLSYVVEWSDDLTAAWQNGAAVVEEIGRAPAAGDGTRVTVRATTALTDAARQFLRLRVTRL